MSLVNRDTNNINVNKCGEQKVYDCQSYPTAFWFIDYLFPFYDTKLMNDLDVFLMSLSAYIIAPFLWH